MLYVYADQDVLCYIANPLFYLCRFEASHTRKKGAECLRTDAETCTVGKILEIIYQAITSNIFCYACACTQVCTIVCLLYLRYPCADADNTVYFCLL